MRDHALIRPIDLRGWPSRGSNRPLTTGCCGVWNNIARFHYTPRNARSALLNHSLSSLFTGFIHRRTGESEEHRVDFRPSGFIIGRGSVKNASCDAWRRSKEIFISIFSFVLKSLYIYIYIYIKKRTKAFSSKTSRERSIISYLWLSKKKLVDLFMRVH